MHNAEIETRKHVSRVNELLGQFAVTLIARGATHDLSKFSDKEMPYLEKMQDLIDKEGPAPYGSEEYKRRTELIQPMVEHHRAKNSHHPEHYANGVAGMDLVDLVEMFLDWKAASERGGESTMNLSHSVEKYEIPPMLESIFRNTADHLRWAHR